MPTRTNLPQLLFKTSLRPSIHISRASTARFFHPSPANMVKEGDSIPSVELYEKSPGNKVNLADELSSGKGVIVGVPAAFSPSCSDTHIPGYVNSDKLSGAGKVFVVSVNDAFVMNAWGKTLDEKKSTGIRFVADPSANFVKALDLTFDGGDAMGTRAKRFAIKTEDGKVTKVAVEEKPPNVEVSSAEKFL